MSYEYLRQKDVFPFRLAKEIGRIEEHVLELNPADEERVRRIHQESIVIDFHNHLYVLPDDMKDIDTYSRLGRPTTGYKGMKQAGMTACLNGMGGLTARRNCPVPWQFEDVVWDLGMRQADMDHHKDAVMRGYSVKDILEAKKSGKVAIVPHIENGGVIGNDLDKLDVLYGLGIRCMGLSYNSRTPIADGSTERGDGGMSRFGLKVIERMNRLGILIDFSHSSDLSTKEGIEASEAPCCYTHAIARGITDNAKGKSDELLEMIAKRGGVIGVEAVPNITSLGEKQTVFDAIDHVEYIVKRVGMDHVAIGTDVMFGDHVAFHKQIADSMGLKEAIKAFNADHVEYIENPGQLPNVTRALVARGFSNEEIKKIMGGNVLRLLDKTVG